MQQSSPEFQPMHVLAPYFVALYQQDLLAEAEVARRAKLASASLPRVPAWRRGLGGVLASAARTLDPSLGERSSEGRGARAMAA
jgi:hypothetical protein